jgi:hypothetical protein
LFNLNFNHSFNQTYIFPTQPQLKVLFIKTTFLKPQPQQQPQYQTRSKKQLPPQSQTLKEKKLKVHFMG